MHTKNIIDSTQTNLRQPQEAASGRNLEVEVAYYGREDAANTVTSMGDQPYFRMPCENNILWTKRQCKLKAQELDFTYFKVVTDQDLSDKGCFFIKDTGEYPPFIL